MFVIYLSIKQGDAKYDWVSGLQVGIANLCNSQAAMKKLVFDQGAIGQRQLVQALAEDFAGLPHATTTALNQRQTEIRQRRG